MHVTLIFTIALAILSASCGPADTCEETEFVPGQEASLTAVTFNVALGPGITRYTSERQPEILSAIADEPFDLLCMQEVWLQEDSDAIASMFEGMGYHVLRADTRGENESPEDVCLPGQLDEVIACAERECAEEDPQDVTTCAVKACTDELQEVLKFNPNCVVCAATSPGRTVEEIEEICTSTGNSRIYDGGNGVLLVSPHPLRETETLRLKASFANRVAQIARIDLPTGPVEVACTHISANQALPPLQSGDGWWTEEKEAQIATIADRLKERAGCGPQIIMGDLNTSTENGDLIAGSESAYDVLVSKGFESPAATWAPPVCSSCAENTFKDSEGDSRLIDHVAFRTGDVTLVEATGVERLFDEPATFDVDGETVESSLSDHFGIRVELDLSTD